MLKALADTSSFSSDRITANVVLLILYVVCVLVVVGLCPVAPVAVRGRAICMSTFIAGLPADFFIRLLTGVAVDLEIAAFALALGLLVGVPLALLLALGGPMRPVAAITVQLLRAAPTFVVMFVLLGVMPRVVDVAGWHVPFSGETTVALSLLPYSASTIAVSVDDARRLWRSGSALAALLLLPNIARAYFVLVMSSGAAAAIGVTEGIAVILRQANATPALPDRLLLFAIGILLFGTILQTSFFLINRLRGTLLYLLLAALSNLHRGASLVSDAGTFPALTGTALPIHPLAKDMRSPAHRGFTATCRSRQPALSTIISPLAWRSSSSLS